MKRRATVSWTSCSAAISVQSVSQNVQIDRLQFSIFWLLTYGTHFAAKVSLCIAPSCVRAKKKPSWAPRSWGITWPKLRYKIGSVGHSCSSELLRELIIWILLAISLVLLDLLVCVCVCSALLWTSVNDPRSVVWSAVLGGWTKPLLLSYQSMTLGDWNPRWSSSYNFAEISTCFKRFQPFLALFSDVTSHSDLSAGLVPNESDVAVRHHLMVFYCA